jgi:glutaredoxin 2
VPNQLVGAPLNTDVTLVCNVEASPKAINYWQRENGKSMSASVDFSKHIDDSAVRSSASVDLSHRIFRYLFRARCTSYFFCIPRKSNHIFAEIFINFVSAWFLFGTRLSKRLPQTK